MPVTREKWPYLQVADEIAARIASGQESYRQGDQLPVLQDIAAEWGVSHETAHRAVQLLASRKLVTTIPRTGSFVGAPREVPGPQQVLAGMAWPAADTMAVTAAELIPAPPYIIPILGVAPRGPGGAAWVIHREQVSETPDGKPLTLSVQWFPGNFADQVPELLSPAPLGPGEAADLITLRARRQATRWTLAFEARQILDDNREGPLLGLEPGSFVQAVVYTWGDDQDVIIYGEYILRPGLVTTAEGTITPGH